MQMRNLAKSSTLNSTLPGAQGSTLQNPSSLTLGNIQPLQVGNIKTLLGSSGSSVMLDDWETFSNELEFE